MSDGVNQAEITAPEKQEIATGFTLEQKEKLEEEGFSIYTLTGKSLQELIDNGFIDEFSSEAMEKYGLAKDSKSENTEIAINLEKNYLTDGSLSRPLVERFLKDRTVELQKKIPGVKAIIGSLADYMDLLSQDQGELKTGSMGFMTSTDISSQNAGFVYRGLADRHGTPIEQRVMIGFNGFNREIMIRGFAMPLIIPDQIFSVSSSASEAKTTPILIG